MALTDSDIHQILRCNQWPTCVSGLTCFICLVTVDWRKVECISA